MNKTARVLNVEDYRKIIDTTMNGFVYLGITHRPNERMATLLQLEYNLGLRISDILELRVSSFVRDGSRYRLDIKEKKTGKPRCFTVPVEIYAFVMDYADEHTISRERKLFPITERAVLKHLKLVCDYLGLEGIGTHSFRKGFATNVYMNSNYNIELVRVLLQHSSIKTTQRYIGIGSQDLENAIQDNICLI